MGDETESVNGRRRQDDQRDSFVGDQLRKSPEQIKMTLENVTWTIRASQIAELLNISAKDVWCGRENASLVDFVRNAQENSENNWRAVWDDFRNWLISAHEQFGRIL